MADEEYIPCLDSWVKRSADEFLVPRDERHELVTVDLDIAT
jgi:hypothetical protein